MLNASSDRFAQDIYENSNVEVIDILVEWIADNDQSLPFQWQFIVRNNQEKFFQAVSNRVLLSKSLIKLIANVIMPFDKFWKVLPPSFFDELVTKIERNRVEPEATGIYTSLLAACYDNNVSNPLHLNSLIFQRLHDRMKEGIVDYNSWERFKWTAGRDLYGLIDQNFVSKIFNDRNRIPDWDRCEFLRRALIVMFLKYRWNPMNIIFAVRDKYTFERIVEFAVQIREGYELFEFVYKKLRSSSDESTFHYKVLKKAL